MPIAFNHINTGIDEKGIYCTINGKLNRKPFPYNLNSFLTEVEQIKLYKMGNDRDLNPILEDGTKTQPFNLIWDVATLQLERLPSYKEFIDCYIKSYCEYTPDNFIRYKKYYESTPFVFTYKALAVRAYKIYFSFVREYHLYLKLKEANLNVFINREDDYMERIDIGVIKDEVLYILDTSLNSQRANNFEKHKLTNRRNNKLDECSKKLMEKYSCKYYVRVPLKATPFKDNIAYNTQSVGKFELYADWFVDLLIFFIRNVPITHDVNLDADYFIYHHKENESTTELF